MKTKTEKSEKSTVKELREIREKIGTEIVDMNYEQLKKYIEEKLTIHPRKVWKKEG